MFKVVPTCLCAYDVQAVVLGWEHLMNQIPRKKPEHSKPDLGIDGRDMSFLAYPSMLKNQFTTHSLMSKSTKANPWLVQCYLFWFGIFFLKTLSTKQLRMQFQYSIKHWIICVRQICSYKAWLEARFAEIQLFYTK